MSFAVVRHALNGEVRPGGSFVVRYPAGVGPSDVDLVAKHRLSSNRYGVMTGGVDFAFGPAGITITNLIAVSFDQGTIFDLEVILIDAEATVNVLGELERGADSGVLGDIVARSLGVLSDDRRLALGSVRPPSNKRFLVLDNSVEVTDGATYIFQVVGQTAEAVEVTAFRGRGETFDPAIIFDEVDATFPEKPVVTTNFTLTWNQLTGRVTLAITTPPTSSPEILRYVLAIGGTTTKFTVPVSQLPYSFDFDPLGFPGIWQWQTATWNASMTLTAENANGPGLASDPVAVPILQSSSWYIPSGAYTYEEVRTGSVNGEALTAVGDIGVPPGGWELRYYPGPLQYEGNESTIHNVTRSPAISPNASVVTALTQVNGTISRGVLLWFHSAANLWRPASASKNFTVQGLIVAGLEFTVTPTITAISGKYPIGSSLSVGFTAAGNTGTTYQWRRNGVAVGTAAAYTPVAGDDLTSLTCAVTITNASAPPLTVVSPAVTVTYPTPTVVSPISDLSVAQESGSRYSISLVPVFGGSNLTYSVTGAAALTINNPEPSLGIDLSAVLSATNITVTASNSGGSVSDVFSLTITASGSASPPAVNASVGGANGSSTDPAFTAYSTDDAILAFVFLSTVSTPFTAPDIAGLSGAYDWAAVPGAAQALTNVSGDVFYRRAASNGADGLQGPWPTNAMVRYVAIGGVDWSEPIGAVAAVAAAGAASVSHPALTLEINNSVVVYGAAFASGVAGQAPGPRADATTLAQNTGSGVRHVIGRSDSPAPTWPAAASVANTGGSTSGRSYAFAIEVRGSTTGASITWPALLAQNAITVTEVTSTAEATANGFTGQSGRLKCVVGAVTVAPTTVSGSFQLVREALGGEVGAPSSISPAATANSTGYTSSSLDVGTTARPRYWWRFGSGASAKYKLAWEAVPFVIQGLTIPNSNAWPALNFVGTAAGEARSYAQTNWNATNVNGQGNASYWGSPLAAAAYASFAGNADTDAYTVAGIKGGRSVYGGPALRGGYSAQHDTGYLCACAWAKLTPRVWDQFDSSWRASLEQFMRWALVAAVGTAREADSAFKGDMLGNTTNASTRGGNPNISSAPSANIAACMAFIGVSTAAAYLQSVVVATEEVAMRTSPWTNIAKSFSLPRVANAPTHAQIQAACRRSSRFNVPLTDQLGMWEAEVLHAFSKTISEGYNNGAGIPSSLYAAYPSASWATGRGRVVAANLAAIRANPDFIAIKGITGAIREMDSTDAGGIRMSASYSEWTHRLMCLYTLIVFTSGTVDRKSARALAVRNRIKGGCAHMRLIGQYGWLSVAHIVQGGLPASPEDNGQWQSGGDLGGWDTAARSTAFGLKWHHDYGRVIDAIYALP